jgi:hypothetical protein
MTFTDSALSAGYISKIHSVGKKGTFEEILKFSHFYDCNNTGIMICKKKHCAYFRQKANR